MSKQTLDLDYNISGKCHISDDTLLQNVSGLLIAYSSVTYSPSVHIIHRVRKKTAPLNMSK